LLLGLALAYTPASVLPRPVLYRRTALLSGVGAVFLGVGADLIVAALS
jgi:hypothetical protein